MSAPKMSKIEALKAKYAANKKKASGRIFAVLLGPRGMGKSGTAAGTWSAETKVLHIVFAQEDHGIQSAAGIAKGDNVVPLLVDIGDAGKLAPGPAFAAFCEVLDDVELISEFDVIVVDGLSALDGILANLPEVERATGYDKKRVVDLAYDKVLSKLKNISLVHNKDIVITCSTEVRSNAEGMFEAPSLRGGSAVDAIIGACPEILPLSKVEDTDGVKFVFTMQNVIRKSGTKMNKDGYTHNVSARVAGVNVSELPEMMLASMDVLKRWKAKKAVEGKK